MDTTLGESRGPSTAPREPYVSCLDESGLVGIYDGPRDAQAVAFVAPPTALVELTEREDGPTGLVIRGRTAGMMKEMVCRSTLWTLALERRASVYAWPGAGRPSPSLSAPSHRALGSGA